MPNKNLQQVSCGSWLATGNQGANACPDERAQNINQHIAPGRCASRDTGLMQLIAGREHGAPAQDQRQQNRLLKAREAPERAPKQSGQNPIFGDVP